ncbi:MAG: FliA/WhiG family RNA polymerase sigma factor, partial [Planctomycetota bacterium]
MPAVRTKPDVASLWRRFKATGNQRLRNVLMEAYLPIVRYNAERVGAKLPGEVEHDDLVSAGVFGLLDAINSFDLHRG